MPEGPTHPATKPNGDTPCGGGCDPLAWLAKWFGTGHGTATTARPLPNRNPFRRTKDPG